ncbi:MAG: aminotransferase class III-fold pyridoxal phosphate-dependent enzyme, partial [bacterium]
MAAEKKAAGCCVIISPGLIPGIVITYAGGNSMAFIPYSQRKYEPLGPKSKSIIERANKFSATNYSPYPFVVESAEGAYLYDPDGNKVLDFLSAYSAVLTHRHKGVIDAVKKEMDSGSDLVSRALYTSRFADFVEIVHEITGYDRVLPK